MAFNSYFESPLPEEGELVAVRVERIEELGVFVTLLEYDASGMVYAEEVSRRRIRSLKEAVRIGQETAAQVMRVNPESKLVDLSIRKCTPEEVLEVLDKYAHHKIVSNLIKSVALATNTDAHAHFKTIVWPLVKQNKDPYEVFLSINNPDVDADEVLGPYTPHVAEFKKHIGERLPKPSFSVSNDVRLVCGDCLAAPEKLTATLNAISEDGVEIFVISPPMYRFVVTDTSESAAQARMDEAYKKAQRMVSA